MKRLFDLVAAGVLFIILIPFLGLLALVIRKQMGAPVIFRQRRPGLKGKPFTIYKFRTMTDSIGRDGRLLSDGQRLTSLGRFLRITSLDELPELINVLKGDMSLVGPRPLLMEYLPYYTDEEQRRHDVRPGITGWAQIHGRNHLPWKERLMLDVWYVDHGSLALDLRILWLTFWRVICRDGVAADPETVETNLRVERTVRLPRAEAVTPAQSQLMH